jgi:hypothetical protein
MIAEDKSILIGKLFNDYWDSLVEHANKVRQETNKLQKSIKRQERTRGFFLILNYFLNIFNKLR